MSEGANRGLKRRADLVLVAIVIAIFAGFSAYRIGAVPVPDDGDESMILQVPYEIINHGKFAWPMYRFLGGGIDETWHSFRPVYYWLLTGFFKIFGWGLTQGRVFTLLGACLLLFFVFLIGRRLFDWRAGFIAVVALVCDPTFLERARMLRNEHVAMMFAMAAFYLYELAEEKESRSLFAASGLVAGAGVMTHTNVLYVLAIVVLLIALRRGVRVLSKAPLYFFSAGALCAMAYEIISDITDLANVGLQYRGDRAHFNLFSWEGISRSLSTEPNRYQRWFAGAEVFPISSVSPTLLHVFQFLIVVALVYLLVLAVKKIRAGGAISDARVRILIATLAAVLFFAIATGPKRKSVIYVVYLSPWFALCVGILGRDLLARANGLYSKWKPVRAYRITASALVILATLSFGLLVARQSRQYLRAVRDPNNASFEELKTAFRSIVPDGVCPVSMLRPVVWLAFPEADRCYASIEGRMLDQVDVEGKEFALFTLGKPEDWTKKPLSEYHVLGEVRNTPYGDFVIYYLGTNSRYASLPPKLYEFNGTQRGYKTISSEFQNLWLIPGSSDLQR